MAQPNERLTMYKHGKLKRMHLVYCIEQNYRKYKKGGDNMQDSLKMLPKLRTIHNAIELIKKNDPGSDFSESALRELIKKGIIHTIQVGNRNLVNIDSLIEYLSISCYHEDDEYTVSTSTEVRNKKKKNGELSFRIRVFAGKKGDGSQDVRTMTWVAPRNLSEAKALKEAKTVGAKFEMDVYNGKVAEIHPKLSEMMDKYLDHLRRKNKYSDGTIDTYSGYRKRINDSIGNLAVDKIETKQIQQLLYDLADGNSKKSYRPLTETTVRNYRCFIKKVLDYSYLMLSLEKINPATLAEIVGKPKQQREAYSLDETKMILSSIECSALETKYKLFIIIAIFCGLRVGEVAGLRYSKIDGNVAYITKQVRNTSQGKKEVKTKTDYSVRAIQLPSVALTLLATLKEEQNQEKAVLGVMWKDDDFVFHNDRGDKMHPDYPRKKLKMFCEQNGLTYKALHAFRHTFCSVLVDSEEASNISLTEVSKAAGHANTAITERCYVHRDKKPNKKLHDTYEGILVS